MVVMGFRHYKNLVLHKAWADFRAEAERTYLGVAWWVLDPLINLAVYYLVFGVIFSQGGPDFVPFLLVGLVTWRFFEATVVRASSSILGNVAVIRQVAFPKVVFPLISVATCLLEYAFSLVLLFIVLLLYGHTPSLSWVVFPVLLAVQVGLVLAFALPLAAAVPFVPDMYKLVTQVLRIMFYMSGVFFDIHKLSPKLQFVLGFNPMVHVIGAVRAVLMRGEWPAWPVMAAVCGVSALAALFGALVIRRLDPLFAKRIAR